MKLRFVTLVMVAGLSLSACSQKAADAAPTDPAAKVAARAIAPDYAVRGQIALSDLSGIAAAGYRTVINNRPDGEEPGQPSSAQIAAEAARLGLTYHYIPVAKSGPTPADAQTLAAALKTAKGPALAYCRSGKRAETIKAMADQL